MVLQSEQLVGQSVRNLSVNLEQRYNPNMIGSIIATQAQQGSRHVSQETHSTNPQNVHVFTDGPSVGLLSQGQGVLVQQQQMSRVGLPTSRQVEQQSIIPSLQALRTTAVNQDLQRKLN